MGFANSESGKSFHAVQNGSKFWPGKKKMAAYTHFNLAKYVKFGELFKAEYDTEEFVKSRGITRQDERLLGLDVVLLQLGLRLVGLTMVCISL